MANVTYTGSATPSLVVSSSGSLNPCDSRDAPLTGNIGVGVPGGYDLMTYQRLASVLYAHPSPPAHLDHSSAAAPPTPPGHPTLLPGQDHILHGGSLELKEGLGGLSPAWPYTMYYPYDTLAAYPFAHGYGMTFDAARRKNATRETTATLKAWLNEHKKNPYPTKGEKIMLAIITKMTLTQVSTWFANARRRLKKENKMTWEPRNKTDDDDAKLSDDDDDEKEPGDKDDDDIKKDDKETDSSCMAETKVEEGNTQIELKSCEGGAVPKTITAALSPAPPALHGSPFSVPKGEKGDCSVSLQSSKPKIWSLADTAACKTPPPAGVVAAGVAGGWLAGGTTFPLPPTIPPSQPQYSRFSQLMSGVNASQYMSGYSSESVGTDTPPQTPPNASKTSSGNFLGSINGGYGPNLSSCGQTLSSCSRGSSNQGINVDTTVHQRYSATVSLSNNNQGNPNSVVMQSNTFSPVYKGNQSASQNPTSQQSAMVTQQQQLQCQQNQQSATVTAAYVS